MQKKVNEVSQEDTPDSNTQQKEIAKLSIRAGRGFATASNAEKRDSYTMALNLLIQASNMVDYDKSKSTQMIQIARKLI